MESVASRNNTGLAQAAVVDHLRQQVRTVHDLFIQYRYSLSDLEQQWIQSTISCTEQILTAARLQSKTSTKDDKLQRRLQSFYTLIAWSYQGDTQTAILDSQFLIATQNINSVMSMLSSRIKRNSHHHPPLLTCRNQQTGYESLPETELSRFLNRRRIETNGTAPADLQAFSVPHRNVQTTIAELRATNSVLLSRNQSERSDNHMIHAISAELPLTFFETVELWRQSAEEAIRAATLQYFEQEKQLRSILEDSNTITENAEDVNVHHESLGEAPTISNPPDDDSGEHDAPTQSSFKGKQPNRSPISPSHEPVSVLSPVQPATLFPPATDSSPVSPNRSQQPLIIPPTTLFPPATNSSSVSPDLSQQSPTVPATTAMLSADNLPSPNLSEPVPFAALEPTQKTHDLSQQTLTIPPATDSSPVSPDRSQPSLRVSVATAILSADSRPSSNLFEPAHLPASEPIQITQTSSSPIVGTRTSPFLTPDNNAGHSSAVSLVSNTNQDPRSASLDLRNDSAVSLGGRRSEDMPSTSDFQQPESWANKKKSRGRMWFERQAAKQY